MYWNKEYVRGTVGLRDEKGPLRMMVFTEGEGKANNFDIGRKFLFQYTIEKNTVEETNGTILSLGYEGSRSEDMYFSHYKQYRMYTI